MATTSPRSSKRLPSTPSPTTTPALARGSSARAAASPRLSALNTPNSRRPLAKAIPVANGDNHEALSASLKQETDQKEQLLVQLQDKDQLITNYVTETNNLTSALTSAESRLNELYAEQSRWESDLAQRIDISEKLRDQVRELEKEKRDLQRRYNEQTATFEAERQAFYDNEQHLKSRIQSLTQARRRAESIVSPIVPDGDDEAEEEDNDISSPYPNNDSDSLSGQRESQQQDYNDPENEPAEMTSLKLELSTLSTSYASLQSTLILMQTQLVDLKRVNQELQEDNESYMILLREKTLSGQFDLMKHVGSLSDSEDGDEDGNTDAGSMRSRGRSTLDRVEEESPETLETILPGDLSDNDLHVASHSSRHSSRPERKRTTSSHAPRGESLADLPITGPGLDLAAELGRAENKDILAGTGIDERSAQPSKSKRNKKGGIPSSESSGLEPVGSSADLDALRTEVKSLKDANKALSLYASKIIDRIIAQEGFEHVLAVDYEKEPPTPSTAVPHAEVSRSLPIARPKPRPQSVVVGRSSSNPGATINTQLTSLNPSKPSTKTQRRSLSFDWKGFSLFSEKKPDPPPNLRPLTLKPGTPSVTSARKLDNFEDEEDRKERERLHATMKLMGIQPPAQSPFPSSAPTVDRSLTAPANATSNAKSNRRFSLFGSKTSIENSDASSVHSTSSSLNQFNKSDLTQEALQHAEAENSLAALDARERELSVEIAKGSPAMFTEIVPRGGRRSRRSVGGSGSGSTVWSAGMSGHGDE